MYPELLERVKRILGFEMDIDHDDILNEFIEEFVSMVNLYCKVEELPTELEFVVVEGTIARWNRRSSEGFVSENIDVIGINYLEDILTPYYPFMDTFKANNSRVRFL